MAIRAVGSINPYNVVQHSRAGARQIMNHFKWITLLTYLGALPFFLAIYVRLSNNTFLGIEGIQWFVTYGLLILSFMAGTLWGQMIDQSIKVKRIAIATNAIVLAAWFAFLLADPAITLIIITAGFVVLYLLEAFVMRHLKRPDYYLTLRLRVTGLVVAAHGIMFFQI
jgi:hypothetical protein|tara:strand:- start:2289 stop:2792 length:504 start_codon:yes stop_codon:yes gene_type:complete